MSASESSSSSRHEVSENTPLLQARTSEQVAWPAAGDTRSEVRTLWSLYWPLWVTQLLDNAILIANVVFVGHLGVFELAAIQLSTSSVSVLGMSVIFGINCALDTLCNQAWTSENPKLVGLYAQKQLVIVSAILAPILILLFNAKPVLLLLRQDPEVAHLAAKCLKVHSLFLPFMVRLPIASHQRCQLERLTFQHRLFTTSLSDI